MPFHTIIEVIVGYFLDKGKRSHEVAGDKAIQENEMHQITTSGIASNQMLLPDSHLTATTDESQPQALKLGTEYEKLLQDNNTKFVADKSTAAVGYHEVQNDTPSDKSRDTNPSSSHKGVTPSVASRHSSRHNQVMINSTTQPVIAGGSSKSKRAKPLRISHKLKERLEEGKERVKEDLVAQQSSVKKMVPAAKPITLIDQKELIHASTDTATHARCLNKPAKVRR